MIVVVVRCSIVRWAFSEFDARFDVFGQVHHVLWLFVDGEDPGDQVGGDQVHATEVRDAPAFVDLDPRAQDHRHHLQDREDQAEEAAQLQFKRRMALRFADVLNDSKGEVGHGAHPKDEPANPDKGRCVPGSVEGRLTRPGETKEKVEEEDDGNGSHVDLEVLQHGFCVIFVGMQLVSGNDESGAQGDEEDGKKEEAVEHREGGHHRAVHRWGGPFHLHLLSQQLLLCFSSVWKWRLCVKFCFCT